MPGSSRSKVGAGLRLETTARKQARDVQQENQQPQRTVAYASRPLTG